MGEGLLASLLLLFLSLLHGADIAVETDMLLSLLQSPVADPETEALARKVSCKPSLRRPPQVSVVLGVVSGCLHRYGLLKATWRRGSVGTGSQPRSAGQARPPTWDTFS